MTSPVAGLYTGSASRVSASTHCPPIKLRRRCTSACVDAMAMALHLLVSRDMPLLAVHDLLHPPYHAGRVRMLPHVAADGHPRRSVRDGPGHRGIKVLFP